MISEAVNSEVRDNLRNAVKPESRSAITLGSRIRSRFARIGLRADIPELRGHKPRPAIFKK
jgi:hypothetical protein